MAYFVGLFALSGCELSFVDDSRFKSSLARCVDIVTFNRSHRRTVTNVLAGTIDPRPDESCSVNSNSSAQSVTRYFEVSITVRSGPIG